MSKDLSNKLHRVGRENWVGNGALEEMWNGHKMLVAEPEGKLLVYPTI